MTDIFGHKHDHSAPDVLIEVAENIHGKLDSVHTVAEQLVTGSKIYYGVHAFREYHWLRDLPGFDKLTFLKSGAALNKAGNLRGMVLDKELRSLFTQTVELGEKLEKVGSALALAGWVIELVKSRNYIKQVWSSGADPAIKSQKIAAEISLATVRALTGAVPSAYHQVATYLVKGAHAVHAPQSWERNISHSDVVCRSVYTTITNPDEVTNFFNTHTFIH